MRWQRKRGFYEKYVKRIFDIVCSLFTIVCFLWLYLIIALVVWNKLGRPVLFKQSRPGLIREGREQIFDIYKFRTMTDERDCYGNLLPDELRLGKFGKWLRSTSLDELPEIFNILKGDMSVIGPRPQLVRDMVFMSDEIRMRHTAKPGLSGLAQVMGRNAITWEQKFEWDLKYIEEITFWNDLKILLKTIQKFFGVRATESAETDVTLDYGDVLLREGRIIVEEYDAKKKQADDLIKNGWTK